MSIQKLSTTTGAGSTAPSAGRFAQTSGGTITTYTSGGVTYQVQTFTSSGTLTVGSSGVVDVLVVGGGGAGGFYGGTYSNGGGGGAGGFYSASGVFLQSGSYTVTIGAGSVSSLSRMGLGSPSSIAGVVVVPGGGNGSLDYLASNGASGGGCSSQYSGSTQYGKGIAGLGNDGGFGTTVDGCGGGGGAGAAGSNASAGTAGAGGAGSVSTITGSSVTYAGGGGGGGDTAGGAGGAGGGGAGSNSTTGTAGTANTGGGGGGGYASNYGGNGGSGVVIVRTIIGGSAAGVAASGGTETTYTGNGTNGVNGQAYKVHTFTSSGSLSVAAPGFVDVLVVGGAVEALDEQMVEQAVAVVLVALTMSNRYTSHQGQRA